MIPAPWLWTVEVGMRVALHTETQPRDERWWQGMWERGR